MDLALNNQQRLICHKTQTNKPIFKTTREQSKNKYIRNIHIFCFIVYQPLAVI